MSHTIIYTDYSFIGLKSMDLFKLLARSTNLQKSIDTSKNPIHQQIPSAGFHEHEEFITHDEHVSDAKMQFARNSRKRRRGERDEGQVSDVSIRFACSEAYPEDGIYSMERSFANPHGNNFQPEKGGNVDGTVLRLDETECRRIMKLHKLKITLLNDENSFDDGIKRSPTSKTLKKSMTPLLTQPLLSFKQLQIKYRLSKRLVENLRLQGYKEPTEVQMGSLPILLGSEEDRGLHQRGDTTPSKGQRSDVDLLTIAPTGSGKTLAFLISIFHGLMSDLSSSKEAFHGGESDHKVQALIITPTHELVGQISNEGRKLAIGTGLKIACMKKGMRLNIEQHDPNNGNTEKSRDALKDEFSSDDEDTKLSLVKVDILVSTPSMLLNSLTPTSISASTSLPEVRYLVLDEADILLDPLFRSQTLRIWTACTHHALQTSLWSATIGSSIESLAQSFILERRRDLRVSSSSKRPHHIIRLVVGLKDSAVSNISHRLIYTATEQGKLLALRQLLRPAAGSGESSLTIQPPFLVFTQTILRAIALHSELLYDIPPEAGGSSRIAVLHSDLSHVARSTIMTDFRKGVIWVLVTTDLLSRGVDFRGVNGVVNYDIPNTGISYVHRVGRTGRQGREGGIAVTLYTAEDIPYVKNVANVIAMSDRVHGKSESGGIQQMHTWLLHALPTVSKRTKKELKIKGVESRRVAMNSGAASRNTRISTKSGYDRKREHKRKVALMKSRRKSTENNVERSYLGDEEWGGFDE